MITLNGMNHIKQTLLELLEEAFEDEIAHLQLRDIRDTQAPRFAALKESHPEIWEDFMRARTGPHEILLRNRRNRIAELQRLFEGYEVLSQPEELKKKI
jgi:hypothetical protein